MFKGGLFSYLFSESNSIKKLNKNYIFCFTESREALEHAMSIKRISWPIKFGEDESEPNSTDDMLEQANVSSCNVIISNRDSNVNIIFANV